VLVIVREFLGKGTFGGGLIDVSTGAAKLMIGAEGIQILPKGVGASLLAQPAGGFLMLGIFIAVVHFFIMRSNNKKKEAVE
jgi:Na+-translocating ferredoxin:NAD+ oxidoreductase RnfE subunit